MLTRFSLYNNSETKKWDEFIESQPKGQPFQLASWMRIIHETYSFEPFMSVTKDANGRITGIFPWFLVKSMFFGARIISNPFSDICGPLALEDRFEIELIDKIIEEYSDQVKYMEIRKSIPTPSVCTEHDYYKQHVIELDSNPSRVFKKFDRKTIKYSIRKAERSRVVIKEDNTSYGIEEFYRLNMITRKKHGVPSQPKKFFENINKHMMSKGLAFITLAIFNSKVIAAGLFFKFKDTIYYKYNASDPAYLTAHTPNHLLTWHVIQKGCNDGYKYFDFGRTSEDNKGLIRYKEMWGAKSFDLPYCYYPDFKRNSYKSENNKLYKQLTGLWKMLPDSVVEKVGPIIIKYFA